jgi:hypothetical protein
LVEEKGDVVGYVDGNCLNQLAARMWLFGLVGLIERHFEVAIEIWLPDGEWQRLLSANRLDRARALQAEKLRQGSSASLLNCLQISDKIAILGSDPHMAADLGYTSKRHMKLAMKALTMLRDHIAHHQDIYPDCMEAALGMAQRLEGILAGSRLQRAFDRIARESKEQ